MAARLPDLAKLIGKKILGIRVGYRDAMGDGEGIGEFYEISTDQGVFYFSVEGTTEHYDAVIVSHPGPRALDGDERLSPPSKGLTDNPDFGEDEDEEEDEEEAVDGDGTLMTGKPVTLTSGRDLMDILAGRGMNRFGGQEPPLQPEEPVEEEIKEATPKPKPPKKGRLF